MKEGEEAKDSYEEPNADLQDYADDIDYEYQGNAFDEIDL